MHFSNSIAPSKRNKVMTPEQFNQVVVAITEGRYSWACVLILRFAGYNPVHFIPYRTYSRLIKENSSHSIASSISQNISQNISQSIARNAPQNAPQIASAITHSAQAGIVSGTADRSHNPPLAVGAAAVSTKAFQVQDLSHLEAIDLPEHQLQGGCFRSWFTDWVREASLSGLGVSHLCKSIESPSSPNPFSQYWAKGS